MSFQKLPEASRSEHPTGSITTCADPVKSIYLATLRARIPHAELARNGDINNRMRKDAESGCLLALRSSLNGIEPVSSPDRTLKRH